MRFLPPKKIYVVYYRHTAFETKGTMLVNARSMAKAIKIAYKTFDPYFYEITNVIDGEEVLDILKMGGNK